VIADEKSFTFGRSTVVRFSKPVFHGPENSALGWVLMTVFEWQDEKFMFAPDVQGPMCLDTLGLIIREKPQLIMIGGPPLYLVGFKVSERYIQTGLRNLEKIVETVPCTILEHHILRDEKWREKAKNVFDKAHKYKHRILTAAEFLTRKNSLLEAERKRLFIENPPSKEFEKWTRKNKATKKHVKPPISL
jgi:predicted metallo-beta-lactamase superfamily hydrolase